MAYCWCEVSCERTIYHDKLGGIKFSLSPYLLSQQSNMHKDSHAVQMGAEENLQIKHLDSRAERPLKMSQEWLYPVLRKLSM